MTVEVLDERAVAGLVPVRDARSHKGSHGRLVAVCGSLDFAGATLLVGMAAARAGAGVVCLAVPASLQPLLAGRLPEAVTIGLPEAPHGGLDADPAVERILERHPEAILIGPGLVAGEGTRAMVLAIVRSQGSPVVLDAQALNELSSVPEWWLGAARPSVVTPHPVEFERLDGSSVGPDDDVRASRATMAAGRWRSVVVLKGAGTVIAAPDGRTCRAPFENPALAAAGTGDVLAGTIGALLAQGLEPYDAARLGVYLHGTAAAAIAERLGDAGLLASDLPHAIALARRDLAAVRDRSSGAHRVGSGQRAGAT